MTVLKTEVFVADIERQYDWYFEKAGPEVADKYLEAVERTCDSVVQHPLLGPTARYSHPRLQGWRFFVVIRPFQKHLLFYQVVGNEIIFRRAMHGHRNLPDRLKSPPKS